MVGRGIFCWGMLLGHPRRQTNYIWPVPACGGSASVWAGMLICCGCAGAGCSVAAGWVPWVGLWPGLGCWLSYPCLPDGAGGLGGLRGLCCGSLLPGVLALGALAVSLGCPGGLALDWLPDKMGYLPLLSLGWLAGGGALWLGTACLALSLLICLGGGGMLGGGLLRVLGSGSAMGGPLALGSARYAWLLVLGCWGGACGI